MKLFFSIIGILIAMTIWYKPLKNGIKTYRFWMLLNRSGGKATEYLRNSPNWKIEATNEGLIKGWFGPYLFRSYGHTFYVYCKTDDVASFTKDFISYRVK